MIRMLLIDAFDGRGLMARGRASLDDIPIAARERQFT